MPEHTPRHLKWFCLFGVILFFTLFANFRLAGPFAEPICYFVFAGIVGAGYLYGRRERQRWIDHDLQLKHDVAAPLGALRIVAAKLEQTSSSLLPLMQSALARTESIFAQHLQTSPLPLSTALVPCMLEIIGEKKLTWGDTWSIVSDIATENHLAVVGDSTELKRILSNLMNNSFEAMHATQNRGLSVSTTTTDRSVLIKIKDEGVGMTHRTLRHLGRKGFSFAKENLESCGQGLGVHHATTTLKSWGGDLVYESSLGNGTTATVVLQRHFA